MFFRQTRNKEKQKAFKAESRSSQNFDALNAIGADIYGRYWNLNNSISAITGMAMGGLRSAGVFSNDKLNEQANALSNLSQKTLPLVIHVTDFSTGNNQSLRLPFFRLFAGSAQQTVDFALIAQKLAETTLIPIMVIHCPSKERYEHPGLDLIAQYLGSANDTIPAPTPAQKFLFGEQRRRIPEFWNPDQPMTSGLTIPAVLRDRHWDARQTFFYNHINDILHQIMIEYQSLTGRYWDAAEFLNKNADHYVVTTEPISKNINPEMSLVRICYINPDITKLLKQKKLSFIERNHSRALATALGLNGYSLVHYGPINEGAILAALKLNDENPISVAGARYTYQEPLSPKEEIYNQTISDLYSLPQGHRVRSNRNAIEVPPALEIHPESAIPLADLHRFWSQNGKYLATNQPDHAIANPTLATGILPAGSGKMLVPDVELRAKQVVFAKDILETTLKIMTRHNYECQGLQDHLRSFTQLLNQAIVQPRTDFKTALQSACDQLTQSQPRIKGELTNAVYLIHPSCTLEADFVPQGGITVVDNSPEFKEFFDALPNTPEIFLSKPENIMLDRDAFNSFVRTEDNAKQNIAHLFSAVAKTESRKKAARFIEMIEERQTGLDVHIRHKLSVNLSAELPDLLKELHDQDLSLAELAQRLDKQQTPVDKQWLTHVHKMKTDLETLKKQYQQSLSGGGRSSHGIISQDAAGTYPWSPVVVPWTQNGKGEGVELTQGIWEAHMNQLCRDIVLLRKADLELKGQYNPRIHDRIYDEFHWKQLSKEELALCPPLVLTGTDADFFGSSSSLSQLFRSGAPVKILIFDTLHSNPAALLQQLVAYDIKVYQSSLSEMSHLIECFNDGFNSSKPVVMNILSPEVRDYLHYSERAVSSKIYTLYKGFHGDFAESLNFHPKSKPDQEPLEGYTFADLVRDDPFFSGYFTVMPSRSGVSVAEYLNLDEEDRGETIPVVQSSNGETIIYKKVNPQMIDRVLEYHRFRKLLNQLVGNHSLKERETQLIEELRQEMTRTVADNLHKLAGEF
jgi:hypothetical protein